ncbi:MULTISPECIES: hypothetical protein [unclassified Microcoleus]
MTENLKNSSPSSVPPITPSTENETALGDWGDGWEIWAIVPGG